MHPRTGASALTKSSCASWRRLRRRNYGSWVARRLGGDLFIQPHDFDVEIIMKRARFILSFAAVVFSAAAASAQGQQDFSKVEIKANKVTDKFYTLDGQGG